MGFAGFGEPGLHRASEGTAAAEAAQCDQNLQDPNFCPNFIPKCIPVTDRHLTRLLETNVFWTQNIHEYLENMTLININ